MSRGRAIVLLLVSLAFVAVGALMAGNASDGSDRLVGIACAAFFGACALVAAVQLLPTRKPETGADGVTIIQPDRVQSGALTVGAAVFAGACPFIAPLAAADGEIVKSWIIWGGAVFFGLGAVLGLWRTIAAKPLLRLDADGVTNLALQGWTVPWRAIRSIEAFAVRGQNFLAFDVDPAAGVKGGAMQGVNRAFGFPPFTVGPQGTGMSFEQLAGLIGDYWTRHRGW